MLHAHVLFAVLPCMTMRLQEIAPLPLSDELAAQATAARAARAAAGDSRWDGASPLDVSGTYGRYLLRKIAKVFPDLAAAAALSDK